MDTAVQIVFILYSLIIASAMFSQIGKTVEYEDFHRGTAILTGIHGAFTIAFLLWWNPEAIADTVAMWVVIGMMWVPWLFALPSLSQKRWDARYKDKTTTTAAAVRNVALTALQVGLVVGFWVL